jgi:taurine dioxygenase
VEFVPITDHIGVHVRGLDLSVPSDSRDIADLGQALADHKVLLFRQGPIAEQDHIRLLAALGRIMHEENAESLVTYVANSPGAYVSGTARLRFHSDWQCAVSGPVRTISLYAVEMEHDDPTIFADMTYAAKSLPDDLRAKVEHLDLIQCHDFSGATPIDGRFRLSAQAPGVPDEYFPRAIQPLLARHRITGEELLNVSEQQTSHIAGMDEAESDEIFAELAAYQYGENNLYVHHWQVHDLLIWDNIALQHARQQSMTASGRRLRRVALNELDFAELFADVPGGAKMR